MEQTVKYVASWVLWPALFSICLVITAFGFAGSHSVMVFNLAYAFLIVSLCLAERWMPHEQAWQQPDGQNIVNILHTLTSKGTVQTLLVFAGVIGLADMITPVTETGYGIWPRHWPMPVQVALGVAASEFALYWAHRLGHEWLWLWRFHAVHHSVTKLWFLNTGRFHFVDSLVSVVLGIAVLVALGAPLEVVKWQAAITAFIGMLTHCNVEMRFGPLSWIFNTPELHRWHHSRDLREGNKNYGENVMIWDIVFGTYFREAGRRPPVDIGIDSYMPSKFTQQILWPFLSNEKRAAMKQRNLAFEMQKREQETAPEMQQAAE